VNYFWIIAMVLLPWPEMARAQTPATMPAAQPIIAITTDVEDGKKMVQAAVTLNGKPLPNVTLDYFVQRTFGTLPIGEDTTLDDGTSAVAFPTDLPASADGKLHAIVRIKTPVQYASVGSTADFSTDVQAPAAEDAFPRALWAPRAPLALMVSIFAVLAAVWLSYVYVIGQILALRKGGTA
jgi:hypothetical protein